jgi:hypothetical protein
MVWTGLVQGAMADGVTSLLRHYLGQAGRDMVSSTVPVWAST